MGTHPIGGTIPMNLSRTIVPKGIAPSLRGYFLVGYIAGWNTLIRTAFGLDLLRRALVEGLMFGYADGACALD